MSPSLSSSSSSIRALLALFLLAVSITKASATTNACFFPNGDSASTYIPCSPTGDGACCESGDFCTEYGYCISNTKGYHYRGGCTDSNYLSPSCPVWCLGNTNSGNSTSVNVIACDAATTGGTWCCAYNSTNCCNTDSTFTPTFGTIFAEPTTSTSSAGSTAGAVETTSTSSTSTTTSSSSTTATAAANSSSTNNTNNNTGTIIGAAVGVPLAALAIAALALFFRERSKRQKEIGPEVSEKPLTTTTYHDGSMSPPSFASQQAMNDGQGQNQNQYHSIEMETPQSTMPTKRFEMSAERVQELPSR